MRDYNVKEEAYSIDESQVASFITKVFMWMFIGLAITFGIAFTVRQGVVARNPLSYLIVKNYYIFFIAEIVVVIAFSAFLKKASATAVKGMFITYSAFSGLTFSAILIIYRLDSIIFSFALASIVFLVMAIYGYVTKEDLSKYGPLLRAGLIVLIVTSIFNMFFGRGAGILYWVITYGGVMLFTALVGFDMNRIKNRLAGSAILSGQVEKYAVYGALELYLDFINLFFYILRIFGKK